MRFLLVDRIAELEPDVRAAGSKLVALSEDYLAWHFPERPILPGTLIIEAAAQLAGWLEAASSEFERWVLLEQVERARFLRFVVPGDTVQVSLAWSDHDGDERAWVATARVGDEVSAEIECRGRVVPLADVEDPERARRAYAHLRGLEQAP